MIQTIKLNENYGIVWFPSEGFMSFEQLDDRLTSEGIGAEKRTDDWHLLKMEAQPQWELLLDNYLFNRGPMCICTSDKKSRVLGFNSYYFPCLDAIPLIRELTEHDLMTETTLIYGGCVGFLVRL